MNCAVEAEDLEERAAQLGTTAVVFRVPASDEFLAEVPGHEWEMWTLGATREEALARLGGRILMVLQRRWEAAH